MKTKSISSLITHRSLRCAYCLLLTAYCLLPVGATFAQVSEKITEADFIGAWFFERAEYWEQTGNSPTLVLREKITSYDSLGRLSPLCLGSGIKSMLFFENRATMVTLQESAHQVEYMLQESEEDVWLELRLSNDKMLDSAPPLTFRYKIKRVGKYLIELTHDALCHDSTGAMHHNILKMFLKTIR
jgi:hypothetical protein